MENWEPIALNELYGEIRKNENDLTKKEKNFWNLIKINPIKWQEKKYGEMGGGFWVVAICGTKIIWYNDIEEGFNICDYTVFGEIEEYSCDQDELIWSVKRLFGLIKKVEG
ncbi:hypothetical protein [Flavobacterium branchiicola]|uniref:Uncharacterized protein n=1 Tax=Flavobacterium branchiicola TaxID=1114875 RepID=A0ABV9PJJ7_9FLAO|nr:hypothetical protein [Flavobacterium branchiicola]MBS7255828.1 hypothetical protein [Flavobacterium branchiicola]